MVRQAHHKSQKHCGERTTEPRVRGAGPAPADTRTSPAEVTRVDEATNGSKRFRPRIHR